MELLRRLAGGCTIDRMDCLACLFLVMLGVLALHINSEHFKALRHTCAWAHGSSMATEYRGHTHIRWCG